MLIKCPECDLQASDKALTCPHCGFPLKTTNTIKTKTSSKHKRLPNGFGQISEIKDQGLRNRYRAMVSVGKNSKGRPIVKLLKPQCYFATYNDAYAALVEYNKNPYDLDDDITIIQLYDKWIAEYSKGKNESGMRTINAAWRYCSSIYDMRVKDLRARHIKACMDEGTFVYKGETRTPSPNIKSRIKSIFNIMLDYALEYEIVDRNYARTFELSENIIKDIENEKKAHMVFTDEEMEKLWNNLDLQYVNIIIVQCYSGWRPQELGLIKLENVFLDKGYMIGGIKTEFGKDRIVPIHPKIQNIIEQSYNEAKNLGSEYLFNCTDTTTHRSSCMMTYDKYRHRFEKIVKLLHLNKEHRAHDGRMHFITAAKKYNVDEYAIKYIVGHKIQDITEKVYTEREINWLIEEMQKIK